MQSRFLEAVQISISQHGVFCLMALGFAFPCTFDDFALFLHSHCLASLIFAYGNQGLGGHCIGQLIYSIFSFPPEVVRRLWPFLYLASTIKQRAKIAGIWAFLHRGSLFTITRYM